MHRNNKEEREVRALEGTIIKIPANAFVSNINYTNENTSINTNFN